MLYALLVAINNYPLASHRLEGCLADLQAIHDYLADYCRRFGQEFRPHILRDEQATRANLVSGFDHFQAAGPDDLRLFFFGGHGARAAAPPEFWALESDKMLETLVCHDSRLPGGYDLMDKELSYLIWNASRNSNLPFVTITDCCHSGRLRGPGTEGQPEYVRIRQVREAGVALPALEYLGFAHYKKSDDGQLSPPLGRRVHFGAARDVETAKEVFVDGTPRGIFTACLLKALQAAGPLVSYAELAGRVQLKVRASVADQSPQLESTLASDKNLRFLAQTGSEGRPRFLVGWQPACGWVVDAGAINGLRAGDSPTLLELDADHTPLTVVELWPTQARVEGMGERDTNLVYPASMVRRGIAKLTVELASDGDPEAVAALRAALALRASDLFQLTDAAGAELADYQIHASGGKYWLSRLFDAQLLCPPVEGYDAAAVKRFLEQLEVVAAWRQTLELTNLATGIPASEIELDLYRVVEPGNYNDSARTEAVGNLWSEPAVFSYLQQNDAWHPPAFQLKIRNTGMRSRWISLLYLGYDFSITNQLLPKLLLGPGEETWVRDVFDGQEFRTISLQIEDHFRQQGIRSIDEHFKLFVSSDELNTDPFNQPGLMEVRATQRGVGFRKRPEERDWRTREITIRVIWPLSESE